MLSVAGITEYADGYSLINISISESELNELKRGDIYMESIEMEWVSKSKEKLKATGFEEIFRADEGDNFVKIDKDFEPILTNSNGKDKYIIKLFFNDEPFKWFVSPTLLSKILKAIEQTNKYDINIERKGEGIDTRYTIKPVL